MSNPLAIALGATPWILYGTLLAPAGPAGAAGGALAAAATLNAWQWRRGRLKLLEIAALPFLAAALVLAGLGLPWLAENTVFAINGALALVAWGSLAIGSPFTLQYARDDWPRELWDNPMFVLTNQVITAVWGTALASVAMVALLAPGWLIPAILVAKPIALTATFTLPRLLPRWALGRYLKQRQPHDWPAPALGRGGIDVAVVGSGIGGLSAAAMLASQGAKVAVYEAHDRVGGYCSSWVRKVRRPEGVHRYVFDAGVHDVSGLGPDGHLRRLLRNTGADRHLEWLTVDRGVLLPDGMLDCTTAAAMIDGLVRRFPAEERGIRAVFAILEAVFRDMQGGIPKTVDEMLAWPKARPTAYRWMDKPFRALLAQHVADPAAQALLESFAGYLTDRPALLTVGKMAPIFGYQFDGGFYPRGGSQALAEALAAVVVENGGTIHLRTPVTAVRGDGIDLCSERVDASAVVYNGDVARLPELAELPAGFARSLTALKPSASALYVTLGVEGIPDLPGVTKAAGVGIANPSRHDPSLAPAGHAAVTLIRLFPAGGWDRAAPDYETRKKAACDELVAAAAMVIPDLEGRTVFREDATPATFARYARTLDGCIYGPALGQQRPPQKTPIPGLILAGAGVFPGAGVEAVALSGEMAAEALLRAAAEPMLLAS